MYIHVYSLFYLHVHVNLLLLHVMYVGGNPYRACTCTYMYKQIYVCRNSYVHVPIGTCNTYYTCMYVVVRNLRTFRTCTSILFTYIHVTCTTCMHIYVYVCMYACVSLCMCVYMYLYLYV